MKTKAAGARAVNWQSFVWVAVGLAIALIVCRYCFLPIVVVEDVTMVRCPEHQIAIPVRVGGTMGYSNSDSRSVFGIDRLVPTVPAGPTIITNISIASDIDTIPEYHDCQRFIVDEAYQSLVSIWVSQTIATQFPDPEPGLEALPGIRGARGPSAVHGTVFPAVLPATPVEAQAVAVLHSTDWGYGPLGIAPDFNCLYLWRTAAPQPQWGAWMMPVQHREGDCLGSTTIDSTTTGKPLEVRRASREGMEPGELPPPVARFSRVPGDHGNYLIVIQCGSTWCEIGPTNAFTANQPAWAADRARRSSIALEVANQHRPPAEHPQPIPGPWKRVTSVLGWNDEQELAIWDDALNRLKPSGVTGIIVPSPDLDAMSKAKASTPSATSAFEDTWTVAATIHVSESYQGRRLKLDAGASVLSICRTQGSGCPGTSGTCEKSTDGATWWYKLVHEQEGAEPVYSCIKKHSHGGAANVIGAGAARWRWLEDDETTWVRCEDGCCTNN